MKLCRVEMTVFSCLDAICPVLDVATLFLKSYGKKYTYTIYLYIVLYIYIYSYTHYIYTYRHYIYTYCVFHVATDFPGYFDLC